MEVCLTCGQPIPQKNYPARIFVATKGLNIRTTPDSSSPTNIVGKLAYEEEVEPIASENGWYKIKYQDKEAWIFAEYTQDISQKPSGAPSLRVGEPNSAQSPNTLIIRKAINDILGGGVRGDCLQCTEYVQYKIKELGCVIVWPVTSGRHGGNWANIFSNHEKYKVLEFPEKYCAMSFTKIKGYGHVAFVEDVLPDGSVKISEANWPGEGKYCERILSKVMQEGYGAKYIKFL